MWTPSRLIDPRPSSCQSWVWYPAGTASGMLVAPYWPSAWQRALGGAGGFSDLLHTRPTPIQAHALDHPQVSTNKRQYPVLVLAPGQSLMGADYTTIAEDLASHGYVVAGINPTYSIDVVLSSDRVIRSGANARDADYGQVARVWGDDMRFVVARWASSTQRPSDKPVTVRPDDRTT
jgi:hypothetical protein